MLYPASVRAAQDGRAIPRGLTPDLEDLRDDKADVAGCDYRSDPDSWQLCRRGDPEASRTLVLLGDSHGRHWIPAMERIAQQEGYVASSLVKSQCSPLRVVSAGVGTDQGVGGVLGVRRLGRTTDRRAPARPGGPDGHPAGRSGRRPGRRCATATRCSTPYPAGGPASSTTPPLAGRVVALGDVPRRQTDPAECLGRRCATLRGCLSAPLPRNERARALAREAVEDAGVRYVDPARWFCAARLCPAVIGDWIAMRDAGHVITGYAASLAEPLGRRLGLGAGD